MDGVLKAEAHRMERMAEVLASHDGLAVMWARRHHVAGMDLDDLIQDARIGLLKASAGFRPELGIKFSTYASYWIRNALLRGSLSIAGTLTLSEEAQTMRRQLRFLLSREGATLESSAQELDLDPAIAQRLLHLHDRGMLRDGAYGGEGEHDTESLALAELERVVLCQALGWLSDDERVVVTARYGIGNSKPESRVSVLARTGVTLRSQRDLERSALEKLRIQLTPHLLANAG